MNPKIIGNTVGMGLPKPNLMQTDPTKGDYIKGKDNFLEKISVIIDESMGSIHDELEGIVKTVNGVAPDENGNIKIDVDENLQVDWNQNDETAPDYLKNRTHWEEEKMVFLIPETKVTVSTNGGYVELSKNCPILTKGKTYIVTLNDVTYECIARTYNNYVIIGNGTIDGDGVNVNNEPFMIDSYASGTIYLNVKMAGRYTIAIQANETIIHTIDPKYLPDSVKQTYTLHIATDTELGGVKSGGDVTVNEDGTMTVVGGTAGGSGAGIVVSETAPDDTSVLWVDTDDNEADNLQTVIDDALAQAKASGDFDGKDGYTPQKGIDYFDGKDGKDGQNGSDYVLTEADKQEIAELTAPLVDVPTDDHINDLINTALGVIENGTY